jgi:hypothetical protein
MLVSYQITTQFQNPDHDVKLHHHENLKSCKINLLVTTDNLINKCLLYLITFKCQENCLADDT